MSDADLWVPLSFWFNRDASLALPIIALNTPINFDYHDGSLTYSYPTNDEIIWHDVIEDNRMNSVNELKDDGELKHEFSFDCSCSECKQMEFSVEI